MEQKNINIGLLGYSFMGKAHTNAYKKLSYMIFPPPANPILYAIVGLELNEADLFAKRFGFKKAFDDYRKMLDIKEIDIFDNCGPNNLHAGVSILALEAGKHVICEKPIARNAEEAYQMFEAAQNYKLINMVAFNYRFVPAVILARRLIKEGRLGRIYHYRAKYLQEWLMPQYNTPLYWRMSKDASGSGVLGDLGSHIIDLGHFLIGDIKTVCALTKTFITERKLPDGSGFGKVDVDDAFVAAIEFSNGVIGTLEASRFSAGSKNKNVFEINGEKGSIIFNLERLNELKVYWVEGSTPQVSGFQDVLVTEGGHPYMNYWWPPGHIIGWEHTFVHELAHFLDCIKNSKDVSPIGADFKDGLRVAIVCDAILKSSETKKQIDVNYGL